MFKIDEFLFEVKFYVRWIMGIWMNTVSPIETLMMAGIIFFFFNIMFAAGLVSTGSFEYCLSTYNRIPWLGGVMNNFCKMVMYA